MTALVETSAPPLIDGMSLSVVWLRLPITRTSSSCQMLAPLISVSFRRFPFRRRLSSTYQHGNGSPCTYPAMAFSALVTSITDFTATSILPSQWFFPAR